MTLSANGEIEFSNAECNECVFAAIAFGAMNVEAIKTGAGATTIPKITSLSPSNCAKAVGSWNAKTNSFAACPGRRVLTPERELAAATKVKVNMRVTVKAAKGKTIAQVKTGATAGLATQLTSFKTKVAAMGATDKFKMGGMELTVAQLYGSEAKRAALQTKATTMKAPTATYVDVSETDNASGVMLSALALIGFAFVVV